MYSKLAFKNVRKSYKDYLLYFLTLTFGICIFYVFNSIDAQQAMMKISNSERQMLKTLTQLMGVISVFVSIILGLLIVGANNFLIRRRKKELGIYMTLGMGKGKIARILIAETFFIGVISLAIGLVLGVFASQWLSVLTAKLFDADMSGYQFIFSSQAFVKTIVYFGIIFVIVMLFSTVAITRYKLIDLINAAKQNEKPKIKSPVLTVLLFILSVACLGVAYALVIKNGIMQFDNMLLFEIILGAIGTFLFFASLSGFFLRLIQSSKKMYFKGLNMFILRQINSRINTAHISLSLICLMLFATIGILSTGLGLNKVMEESYITSAPNDVTISSNVSVIPSVAEKLKKDGFDLSQYTDETFEFCDYRKDDLQLGSILTDDVIAKSGKISEQLQSMKSVPLMAIRLSDYNRIMQMTGRKALQLKGNEAALFSEYARNMDDVRNLLTSYLKSNKSLSIGGKSYTMNPSLIPDSIVTSSGGYLFGLIVPDEAVTGFEPDNNSLIFNCKGDSSAAQDKLVDDITALYKAKGKPLLSVATRNVLKTSYAGSKAVISFVGIYLGLIFLITSAAILALQQLSEVSDNRRRYAILQKIGADQKLINRSIFKQTGIYFLLPLLLACVHSVVGISVANQAISSLAGVDAVSNILITALVILAIYGTYFIATYLGSKSIILKNDIRTE